MKMGVFYLKRALYSLAFPVGAWIICEIICRTAKGVGVFGNFVDFRTLLRTFIVSFTCSLAMACNLPAGRFDMSLGAQRQLVVIVGSLLGFSMGLDAVGLMLWNLLFGLGVGLIVGLVFSKLRILPMVYGLGMALVLECIAFAVKDDGITFYGRSVTSNINSLPFIITAMLIIVVVVTVLFNFTSYGYEKKTIEGNQGIAQDVGINILKNCVICYLLAGALIGVSGTFDIAYTGSLTPVLGNGTISIITAGLLPFMLGSFIGHWSNKVIGMALGSLTIRIFIIGLSKLMLSISIQNLLLYSIFVLYLVISANAYRVTYYKNRKKRIAQAKKLLEQRS